MADLASVHSGYNTLRRQRERERGSLRGTNPTTTGAGNRTVSATSTPAAPRPDDRYDSSSLRAYDVSSLRVPRASEPPHHHYDHHQPPRQALRSTSSRFSLNEHFSATRSVYDFGFDDASSYMPDDASVISAEEDEGGGAEVEGLGLDMGSGLTPEQVEEAVEELEGDFYDILCLPRHAAESTQGGLCVDDVRAAYYRMFFLFYPGSHPEGAQGIATRIFLKAQEALEVLVDEGRRARYDAEQRHLAAGAKEVFQPGGYEDAAREEVWSRLQGEMGMASDLGVRFDLLTLTRSRGAQSWRPLDFNVGHSTTRPLPISASIFSALKAHLLGPFGSATSTTPTLTLAGSVYGVLGPLSRVPVFALASPHQPLRPATSPRHRLLQLTETKVSPVIAASIRHEIARQQPRVQVKPDHEPAWLKSELEYGLDILPETAPLLRSYHHVRLPYAKGPTVLEASLRGTSLSKAAPPRVALGLEHQLYSLRAFARVDSGDWNLCPEALRFLSGGSPGRQTVAYADFPLQIAPSIQVGFMTAEAQVPTARSSAWPDEHAETSDSLLPATDAARRRPSKAGWWTASTTVLPLENITSTVRYTAAVPYSASHIEAEYSCGTIYPNQVSLRHLFPVTASSSLGFELSVSQQSTHLSLHLSRLSQRLSIPLLLPSALQCQTSTLFYAAAVPLLAAAVYRFWKAAAKRGLRNIWPSWAVESKLDAQSPAMQAAVAIRREVADHLTGLLAQPVGARQRHHAARNGLVILSAKLGVPDLGAVESPVSSDSAGRPPAATLGAAAVAFDPDQETADVTVALAALIDDQTGTLTIPRGVRKGRIPGFWDPAPDRQKVLLVRYAWQGIESLAAVRGEEELVLPPR